MDGTYGHRRIPLRGARVRSARNDRASVPAAGGLAGVAAGIGALMVIHGFIPDLVLGRAASAASVHGVSVLEAVGVAYLTAGSLGGLVGGAFALLTRSVRRWTAQVLYALGAFVSPVTMGVVAFRTSRDTPSDDVALALVLAAATFAVIASLELPRRRRSR